MQAKQVLYLLIFCAFKSLHSQNDTLNKLDSYNCKQGYWILKGRDKPNACYTSGQIVEIGFYKDNRKTGIWKEYFCNGNLKNIITFENGKPSGLATIYYENGNTKEKGLFTNNRWIGKYYLYYDNGNIEHEFNYNEKGKREGKQLYYYENGKLYIECSFKNGIEITDSCWTYTKNGELEDSKVLDNYDDMRGKFYGNYYRYNQTKTNDKKDYPIYNDNLQLDNINDPKQTLYNSKRQITKDGIFKGNQLMDGKEYIYDINGNLIQVKLYKSGKYIGNVESK